MDDFDLDDILDSVDVNSLPVAPAASGIANSQSSGAKTQASNSNAASSASELNIDDLLEDVAESMLSSQSTAVTSAGSGVVASKASDATIMNDDIDDVSLGSHMHNKELSSWSAAIVNMPPEIRSKWNAYFEEDSQASCNSRFLLSDAYLGSDAISAKKVFQECVRKALKKNGVSEMKINDVMSAVLSDPVKYNELIAAFKRELLTTHKGEIMRDIDYDPKKFPNLASYFA